MNHHLSITNQQQQKVVKGYEPEDGSEVVCEWMNKDDMPVEKAFHQEVLIIYEPPPMVTWVQF